MDDPFLIDGRYRLERELGAGAFGSVWKATQVALDQDMRAVALKLFHNAAVSEANVRAKMNDALAVIDLLSKLPDWEVRQHFVTIFDLGVTREAKPRGFVAMELVPGGSLEGRLRDFGKFSLQGTQHYLLQIARALAFMHDNHFVHSDLKPPNVLLFRGRDHDTVKIGDFGLAGRYGGPLGGGGPAGGTLSYLPAESLMGLQTMPATDVFSMGVMAYEMLSGENPYVHAGQGLDSKAPDYQVKLNEAQLKAREPALQLKRDDFPELRSDPELAKLAPLLDVVNKMLAASLSDRYASARAVLEDLKRIEAGRPPALKREAEQGAAKPQAADDPVTKLAEECNYLLTTQDWAGATAKVREVLKAAPQRPDGYLLQSQIVLAQAERRAQGGSPADAVNKFRAQAVGHLTRGLKECVAPADKEELRQMVIKVYRLMNDLDMVRQYQVMRL